MSIEDVKSGSFTPQKKVVLDDFFFVVFTYHIITETPGTRTPDNLIKSQVLYHLS